VTHEDPAGVLEVAVLRSADAAEATLTEQRLRATMASNAEVTVRDAK
jgi:hypothetical protein